MTHHYTAFKKQTNKQKRGKNKNIKETRAGTIKVSPSCNCKLILYTGWASLVSKELCRRACMHVCHLTCALLCLSRDRCVDVYVCVCVCVVGVNVCTYMKQATNEPQTGWSVMLFYSFFVAFSSYNLTCQVLSWALGLLTNNVTALCVKCGVKSSFLNC